MKHLARREISNTSVSPVICQDSWQLSISVDQGPADANLLVKISKRAVDETPAPSVYGNTEVRGFAANSNLSVRQILRKV